MVGLRMIQWLYLKSFCLPIPKVLPRVEKSSGAVNIVDATVFGEGVEHHTLKPILEGIQDRFKRLSKCTQKTDRNYSELGRFGFRATKV
jgi:hypothetical protein